MGDASITTVATSVRIIKNPEFVRPSTMTPMTIEETISAALQRAQSSITENATDVATSHARVNSAIDAIFEYGSEATQQMVLAIVANTADDPTIDPSALQLGEGIGLNGLRTVDRRSQGKLVGAAINLFLDQNHYTARVSQDPGVSNPWREPRIDMSWSEKRRHSHRKWADATLEIVRWLEEREASERSTRAKELLDAFSTRLVLEISSNQLNYPRFKATPGLAMKLVREFINEASNRPDATEAAVAACARVLATAFHVEHIVERGDTNAPDGIDVLIKAPGEEFGSGIEVTDAPLTLNKLNNEVIRAMLDNALDHVTIISKGKYPIDAEKIDQRVEQAFSQFGQRIDIVDVDVIETWLAIPAAPRDMASDFLASVGRELDKYSSMDTRRSWFTVMQRYVDASST